MRIHTKIVIDIETGRVVEDHFYHYEGPVALCDRSQQAAASGAEQEAARTAGQYGSMAAAAGSTLLPQAQRWTVSPPGYGPQGLAEMETRSVQAAKAGQGAAQEASRLRALRTGNAAGLGSLEAAEAEGGARGAGSAVQDILAKNAMLKSSQQEDAMKELGGLYGQSMRGGLEAQGLVPEDIKANLAAGQQGWLQNAEGIVAMLGGSGGAAGGAKSIQSLFKP